MAERQSVLQQITFGKETVPGTTVATTNRLMAASFNPSPKGTFKSWRPQGNKAAQLQLLLKEWAAGSVKGWPCYDELGFLLASAVSKPQSVGGTPNVKNVHTFTYNNRAADMPQTWSVEYGDPTSVTDRVSCAFLESMGIDFSREDDALTGSIMSQALVSGVTPSAGVSEVQALTFTGIAVGATTYKIGFKGDQTTSVAYTGTADSTSASNLQTVLNALAEIGASGVTVAPGSAGVLDVTFSGSSMTGIPQPLLSVASQPANGNTLTPTEVTRGGFTEATMIPILPGHLSVYSASTYAGLSSGLMTRTSMSNWQITNRSVQYWVMNAAVNGFLSPIEAPITVKFTLEMQANSTGMAFLTNARNGTPIFLRIQGVGPLISGSDYHTITIDSVVKVAGFGEMTDKDGVYQVNYEMEMCEDTSGLWDNSMVITLQNGLTGY